MKTWIEIEFDITISNCKLYWDVTFPTLKFVIKIDCMNFHRNQIEIHRTRERGPILRFRFSQKFANVWKIQSSKRIHRMLYIRSKMPKINSRQRGMSRLRSA